MSKVYTALVDILLCSFIDTQPTKNLMSRWRWLTMHFAEYTQMCSRFRRRRRRICTRESDLNDQTATRVAHRVEGDAGSFLLVLPTNNNLLGRIIRSRTRVGTVVQYRSFLERTKISRLENVFL